MSENSLENSFKELGQKFWEDSYLKSEKSELKNQAEDASVKNQKLNEAVQKIIEKCDVNLEKINSALTDESLDSDVVLKLQNYQSVLLKIKVTYEKALGLINQFDFNQASSLLKSFEEEK